MPSRDCPAAWQQEARARRLCHLARPYLPVPLLPLAHGDQPAVPFPCTMLYADLCGFTALTEELARRDSDGNEWLSGYCTALFDALLRVARLRRGELLNFDGDALCMLFPARAQAAATAAAAAMHAAAAGMASADAERHLTRLRIGIAGGVPLAMRLGDAWRHTWLLAGGTVAAMHAAAGRAAPGTTVVANHEGAATAAVLPATAPLAGWRQRLHRYAPMLPPGLLQRLATGATDGMRRRVAVLCGEIDGVHALVDRDGVAAATACNEQYMMPFYWVVRQHHGMVARLSTGIRGLRLLVLFGAIRAGDDDDGDALQCALALRERFAGTGILRCGVASGPVYCTTIGSTRREFTVMGMAVNLAARLAQRAPHGDILADAGLIAQRRGRFPERRLQVRGVTVPVAVATVRSLSARSCSADAAALPFVGRKRELLRLQRWAASALAGAAGPLVVSGSPGIGKSRLLEVFAAAAPARVVRISCHERQAGSPYWLLQQLPCHLRDAGGAAETVLPYPDARAERLAECLLRARPVLLIIDDAQWLDAGSLRVVVAAFRGRSPCGLLLARRQAGTLPAGWQRLRLRELSRRDIAELAARSPCAARLDAAARRQLYERSRGNPLIAGELLARVAAGGTLVELPARVQALLQGAADARSAAARRLLQFAAVAGDAVPTRLLRMAGGSRTATALAELCRHRLLRRQGKLCLFRHALIRETVHASLSAGFRRRAHLAAGNWLVRHGGAARAAEIARHFSLAGDGIRAAPWQVAAAAQALAAGDVDGVRAWCAAARAGASRDTRAGRRVLAEAYGWEGIALRQQGAYRRALASFAAMNRWARLAGNRRLVARSLYYRGATRRRQGRQQAALHDCRKALALARTARDRALAADCLNSIAVSHWYLGDFRAALRYGEHTLRCRRRSGDRQAVARCLFTVGNALVKTGDYAAAARHFRELLQLARHLGDRYGEAYAQDGLGVCAAARGRYAQARQLHRAAYRRRTHLRDNRGLTYAALGLAAVARQTGNWRMAARWQERAAAQVASVEDGTLQCEVRLAAALTALQRGEWRKATAGLRDALRRARRMGYREGEVRAVHGQALLAWQLGRQGEAQRQARAMLALAARSGMAEWQCRGLLLLAGLPLPDRRRHARQALLLARRLCLPGLRQQALTAWQACVSIACRDDRT